MVFERLGEGLADLAGSIVGQRDEKSKEVLVSVLGDKVEGGPAKNRFFGAG